jgi:predicted porin
MMPKRGKGNKLAFGAALAIAGAGVTGAAHAQSAATDAQIQALQAKIEQLQRQNQQQINELQRQLKQMSGEQAKANADAKVAREQAAAAQAKATAASAKAQDAKTEVANAYGAVGGPAKAPRGWFDSDGHGFFERKPGSGPLTFFVPGGEISAYGNLDVSFDDTSKNVKGGLVGLNGPTDVPAGNFGWMPAISTNLSYFGVRGFQHLYDTGWNFVWQAEAGFDISATPGLRETNSNLSQSVNGALFSRNSYIGLSSPEFGAIKIGKTDAPYKNSTAAFNPFAGQIGDYSVIMGNSGGDNRVEFGTRLSHAIWYESPSFAGFQLNALFSPGQNRSNTSDNIPAGEPDCAGGNIPGSGGTFPVACNDGAFSNAVSANLSYTNGPFYATAAYERHFKVNRQSDISGLFGFTPTAATPTVLGLFNDDVADEDAFKVGALYRFATKTTVGGILERMHRYVPADLAFQNERQRYGSWLFLSQELTPKDSIHFGWAHAFKAQGDPGQHNDGTLTIVTPDGAAAFAPNNNQADMITASWKHKFSDNLTWYTAAAATFNGPSAHFDLGAGGRGVTTDCHDATGSDGGNVFGSPRCWTGTTIVGVSTGLQYRF